jgi:hypothetical protein
VTRLEVRRRALRHDLVRQPAPARRAGLTWPRLPAAAEVAITGAGYLGYALVRLAVRAGRHAALAHAAELWRAERRLHLDVEPSLNHLVAARHDPADHPGDQPPARSPSPPAAPARTRHALAELATPPPGRSRWYHQRAQLARDGGITLVS